VAEAAEKAVVERVFFQYDDYGTPRWLCRRCFAAARLYANETHKERIDDYPLSWSVSCADHLDEWYLVTSGTKLSPLLHMEWRRCGAKADRSGVPEELS
jgi:hypothetical protein